MRTIASLRPFPMSAGNFVGNTIEKAAVLPISIPPRKKYLVYSLFTQGEASGLCSPTRKSVPNQGTYMGTETAPPPEQCATTAKTSECQRAGHKKGGAGGHPPRLFASGLSLEKAWIPRPGPGGNPPRRCQPAPVQTRTTYQGQPGAAYPLGGVARKPPWGAAPRCPACPAGVPISPEKWGERGPGASPLAPRVLWPACCRSLILAVVPHCPGHGAISLPIFVP